MVHQCATDSYKHSSGLEVFLFPRSIALARLENPFFPTFFIITGKRENGWILAFPKALALSKITTSSLPYLPTPPLGQDMTQGQFLSGV